MFAMSLRWFVASLVVSLALPCQKPASWADAPVLATAAPAVADDAWTLRALDRFVLRSLEVAGERPSPAADRRTLARRLAFDLTGLPPTRAQVQRLVDAPSEAAYEQLGAMLPRLQQLALGNKAKLKRAAADALQSLSSELGLH